MTADRNSSEPSNDTHDSEELQYTAKSHFQIGFRWLRRAGRSATYRWFIKPVILNAGVWTAAATVAIAVATIIYTHYAKQQLKIMNDTLGQVTQQTPKIAAQAQAAQDQVGIVKDQMLIDERPWVDFSVGDSAFTSGRTINVPLRIFNAGKTPAFDVRGRVGVFLVETNDAPDFRFPHGYTIETGEEAPNTPSDFTFAAIPRQVPKGEIISPVICTLQMQADYIAGKLAIMVQAKLNYGDAFGVAHWSQYCSLNYRHSATPPHADIPLVEACARYNSSDRNTSEEKGSKNPN